MKDNPVIKYTSDGKKVIVLGKLNSQETIVQEIFIINEQEIPSGESFVVKNLHDAPAKSWYETRLESLKMTYDTKSKQYAVGIRVLKDNYDKLRALTINKCDYLRQFVDNASIEQFDRLTKFLTGNIKYIVCQGYDTNIIPFDEILLDSDKSGLRLLTLFGRGKGVLDWGINKWADGSGIDTRIFDVATDYEEAKASFKLAVAQYGILTPNIIKNARTHNIELDAEMLEKYKETTRAAILKNKASYLKTIEKFDSDLAANEQL